MDQNIGGWIAFLLLQWFRFSYTGKADDFLNQATYAGFCDMTISLSLAYPILCCISFKPLKHFIPRVLAYFGQISYGIYLYHYS